MKTYNLDGHDMPKILREKRKDFHIIYSVIGTDPCITVYGHDLIGTNAPDGIMIVSNVEGKPWYVAEMSRHEFNAMLVNLSRGEKP